MSGKLVADSGAAITFCRSEVTKGTIVPTATPKVSKAILADDQREKLDIYRYLQIFFLYNYVYLSDDFNSPPGDGEIYIYRQIRRLEIIRNCSFF
jgi:hypothetical protein